jgi:hypothetical protein
LRAFSGGRYPKTISYRFASRRVRNNRTEAHGNVTCNAVERTYESRDARVLRKSNSCALEWRSRATWPNSCGAAKAKRAITFSRLLSSFRRDERLYFVHNDRRRRLPSVWRRRFASRGSRHGLASVGGDFRRRARPQAHPARGSRERCDGVRSKTTNHTAGARRHGHRRFCRAQARIRGRCRSDGKARPHCFRNQST